MAASRLVLWRHGRTASNLEGRFQGQLDVPLDDVGRQQARAAAPVLAGLRPDRLVSSDLARARGTADELAALTGAPVVLDHRLRELHAGAWEGLLHGQIEDGWPRMHAAWRSGEDVAIGGGERRSEVGARVAAALREHAELVPEGGTLVAASHSSALRAGLLALLGLPVEVWPRFTSLGNGRWALVERRPGGWALRGYDLGAVPTAAGTPAPAAATASAAVV